MKKTKTLFLFFILQSLLISAQNIYTIAGSGHIGFAGDGGPSTAAVLNYPIGLFTDDSGSIYIADTYNYRVRKITKSGIINTIAGTTTQGYNGDGISATTAKLYFPQDVFVDRKGNVFIADCSNQRIRKVNTSGIISTIAGNGIQGFGGDGGPATAAKLNNPNGVSVDGIGNIYIADYFNNRIRKVDTSGKIHTIAGNGTSGYNGDGGPATAAEFADPTTVILDTKGNIYFCDALYSCVRRIDTSGIISTIAGNGTGGFTGDGGLATNAEIYNPIGIRIDTSGNIYFSDAENERIRKIDKSGIINTIAGNGIVGYSGDGGPATSAEITNPSGLAIDKTGNIYIADYGNSCIREIGSPLGVNEITNNNSFLVYPNPSRDIIYITASNLKGKLNLKMYNIMGQEALNQNYLPSQKIGISTVDFPLGIYILRLTTEDGKEFTKRIEVVR